MLETNAKQKRTSITAAQLGRYCRNNRLSFISTLLVSAMLMTAMWGKVAQGALLSWVGLLLTTQAAQLWYSRRYLRADVQAEWEQKGWMPGLMAAAIATGAAWSAAFFMLGLTEGHPMAVLMIFVIAGITAYAGVAKSDVFPLAIAFEAATLLPMCLWLFMQSSTVANYMGFIGLLYLLLLNFLLRQISGMVLRVRSLSEQNTDLSAALQRVETLEREGAMFRSMFETIADPAVVVHDPADDNRILYANPAACRHFGGDLETVQTLRPRDFDVRIDAEKRQLLRERLARHGRFAFQSVHRRLDGEEVPVEVVINMFQHEGEELMVTFVRNIAARQAAEARMHELELAAMRERDFRSLADNLPVAVIRYDSGQRRQYVNAAAARMLHGCAEQLLGGVPGEGGIPALPAMIGHYRQRMAEVLASGAPCEFEFVLDALPQEAQEHFAIRFAAERGTDGQVVGVLAIWFDITERRQLEEQVRMKGLALDHSSEAMYLVGEQGRFVYVNEQACRALGYAREELLTLSVADIDPDFKAEFLHERPEKLRAAGGSFVFETTHQRRDGSRFPVEIQVSELEYNGQVLGMTLARDISERKRAAQALAESAQMLRDVLQGIPDPVWMKDAKGTFVVCNHGVARLFNMPVDEIVGKDDFDFFPPEQAEFYQNKDRAALEAGHVLVNEEWWTFGDNGEQVLMETCKTPVRSPDGKLLGVLGVARDITARKAAEKAYRESEAMLQEAQRIAHVGSWDVDMVNDKLTWSDETFRIWEIDKTKFKADFAAFLETVHPDDRERVNRAYNEAVVNRTLYEVEHRLLFPDGRIKHILERGEPQYDEQGKPVRFIGTSLEVTERKQAERALQQSEMKFRTLYDSTGDAVMLLDEQGFFDCNASALKIFGCATHEAFCAMHPADLSPAEQPCGTDSLTLANRHIAQAMQDGSHRFEWLHRRADSLESFPAEVLLSALELDGKPVLQATVRDISARKAIETALLDSKHQLQEAQRIAQVGSWALDLASGRLEWSDEIYRIFEIDPQQFGASYEAFLDAIHPDDREAVNAAYSASLGNRLPYSIDHRLLFADGRIKYVRECCETAFGEDGKPLRSTGTVQDITDLKQMEIELQQRERDFRSLAGNMPDNIARWDVAGRYLYVNPTHERLLGMKLGELIGKPIPDSHEQVKTGVMQVLATGQAIHAVRQPVLVEGIEQLHDVSLVPEFDASGKIVSVLGIGRDMTERYRMQEAIAAREQEFRSLAENSPDPIYRYDRACRRIYANEAVERLTGIPREAMLGRSPTEFVPVPSVDAIKAQAVIQSVLDSGERAELELTFTAANGQQVAVHNVFVPELDAEGAVQSVLCLGRDISEHKRMANALAERQAFLDSLFEAIPVPVFYKDREGRYLGFNRAYESVFGASRENLIGKSVFDTHPRELAETYHAKDKEVFERRVALQQYEYQIKHADGTLREVLFSKAAFDDAQGEVKGLIGAVIDITERKQNEAELQNRYAQIIQLNERLEQNARHLEEQTVELEYSQTQLKDALEFTEGIINAIPDLLFEVDIQGRYLNVWAQNPELLAAQKSALLSRTINEVLAPESAAICMAAIQEAEENGVSFGKVFRLELPDGEHWFEISVSLQAGKATPGARFLVLSRDVTARMQAEAELQKRYQQIILLNERLEQNARDLEEQTVEMEAAQEQLKESLEFTEGIINAIPDILFEMDLDGSYLNIWTQNPEVLAEQKKALLGKRVHEILSPQAAELALAAIREAHEQGFAYSAPIPITQLNGETRWYEHSLARKSGNGLDTVIALSRDVTARMQADIVLDEMRQRLHTVVQTIPDLVWLKDAAGVYLSCNSAFEKFFGASEAEIVGKTDYDFVDQALADFFREKDAVAIQSGMLSLNEEWVTFAEDGRHVLLETRKVPVYGADGHVVGVLGVARDITARKRMEEALVQREQEFRTLVENSADTVARYDRELRRVYANPAFGELVEGGVAALVGKRPVEAPGGEGAMVYEEKLGEVIASGQPVEFELKWHSKDGREVCSLINLTPEFGAGGEVETVLAVGRDISELHAFRQKIHQMAFYDPLTALPNRALFNDRLRQMIADASWHGQLAGVMMIDMDRFKAVNDTMGHAVGDELLRETGARLSACVRAYDTVARLGGDEFAVLLPDVRTADDLGSIADKMRAMFDEPFLLEGKEVFVSCSIGIALYPDDSIAPDDLVKYADSAMYFAKRSGRNNFRFYASELTAHANERLTLESELRRALERKELSLHFQPKVRLMDGVMNGSEALLRWQHPQRGFVPPDKFIPIAEDSGLIIELGEWVLREACRMACEMNGADRPLHKVAINLSARQFVSNDLLSSVTRVLEETGCYPEWIELEITESLLLDEEGEVLEVLKAFRALGITIAIDDFGTGYSALSYLARFPINTLKIDRSFIRSITTDNYRAELVKAILSIAHCLGQQVVAEGVETAEQALFLQAHGCQVAQGYLYSKPVPRGDLLALPQRFDMEEA
ncbi:MAG: PAS domain S-box protein [Pseudomonadota bacterium]